MESTAAAPLSSMLHPAESSRFVLALVASVAVLLILAIVVLGSGLVGLVYLILLLLAAVASVWAGLQVNRARLLGRSVRVTAESFPLLDTLIETVRRELDYHRRVDVYVIDKSDQPVAVTSYLGTRIVLIQGGIVAELSEPAKEPQLVFLLARHIGALKAEHTRLNFLLALISAARAVQIVTPFLLPYYRATAYSGDQIGLWCCGSLDSALEAMARLLVGKELATEIPFAGVVRQSVTVQRDALPRFAQLLSSEPHVTNRFLNLLTYGRVREPETWARLTATLDASTARELEDVWALSPHRLADRAAPSTRPFPPPAPRAPTAPRESAAPTSSFPPPPLPDPEPATAPAGATEALPRWPPPAPRP